MPKISNTGGLANSFEEYKSKAESSEQVVKMNEKTKKDILKIIGTKEFIIGSVVGIIIVLMWQFILTGIGIGVLIHLIVKYKKQNAKT